MYLPKNKLFSFNYSCQDFVSPGGGIGRRKGLKIPREQSRAGSTPALGRI